LTKEVFGYETYGYWLWHNTEEAVKDCEENVSSAYPSCHPHGGIVTNPRFQPSSVFNLLYPADPEDWKRHFAPVGKGADYVSTGKVDPLPSWYNLSEYTTRDRILAAKGYRGPLNWYKAGMRGINLPDEEELSEEDRHCKVPTLLAFSDQDYVTRADMQTQNSKKWVKDYRIEVLNSGHWIQLEKPAELQKLFEGFATEVTV
jgi:soluble epoxide hydrolase/lipid-phosphate phosphatase